MARKRFIVVVPNNEGGMTLTPMKQWLRDNPNQVPFGLDPAYTNSRQLFAGLKKSGWNFQESEEEIRLFPQGVPLQTVGETEESDDSDTYFALESQLQDFIASNIERISINGMKLKLYKDAEGRLGKEYRTSDGNRIDILAVEENGDFVVFELKKARSPYNAIGQVTSYMGWVMDTIGKGKNVRGVIVAGEIDDNLRYSIRAIPNISLFEYEVSFTLNEVKGFDEK